MRTYVCTNGRGRLPNFLGLMDLLISIAMDAPPGSSAKNTSECIVEVCKHAGIFKNTREVQREARGAAECFSHFSSVLKNSQALILLNNARG